MASIKRRRLTLAATLVSLSALVAACGGGGGSDNATQGQGAEKGGKVVLKYWDMQWGSPTFMGQLKKNVAEFNKANPSIEVKFTELSWGDYQQKLLSAVQAGNPPDIGGGDSGIAFNMDAQGQTLDITDLHEKWAKDGTFADMPEWAYKKWDYNGKKVGITWQFDQRAIFYRKDLFAQAGIPVPKTWDDLLAAAQKLHDPSKGMVGIAVPGKQGSFDTDQFYMTLALQAGGGLADAQGNPTFNSAQNLTALEFEKKLVDCCTAKGTPSWTFTEVLKQFEQGKAAMAFGGGWYVADIQKNAPKIAPNVGVLPVLIGPGGPEAQHSVSFANPWMIYKQTKHPAEAKKFLEFMMQKQNLGKLYAAEPGAKWPVYKSLLEIPVYQSNELIAEVARQTVENGVDYWYPNNAGAVGIGSMGTSLTDIIVNPVVTGSRSPEDALADAQEQLAPLFEQQGG
jgi:ABC-type glycerol-3-phosphate transport system substrate-binding protein